MFKTLSLAAIAALPALALSTPADAFTQDTRSPGLVQPVAGTGAAPVTQVDNSVAGGVVLATLPATETVISVEHVVTANYISCMSSTPEGCRFHHYTLIDQ